MKSQKNNPKSNRLNLSVAKMAVDDVNGNGSMLNDYQLVLDIKVLTKAVNFPDINRQIFIRMESANQTS